jgi:hypothetical protein
LNGVVRILQLRRPEVDRCENNQPKHEQTPRRLRKLTDAAFVRRRKPLNALNGLNDLNSSFLLLALLGRVELLISHPAHQLVER